MYTSSTRHHLFNYYTFSDTCVMRSDTKVSCRIIEQDMDIGCVVQCDQTRIESFKLRVRVDEIEGGSKDKLAGVNVIKQEEYKIPVDYSVLNLVKGENLDFVVVSKKSDEGKIERYILMYDVSTSLIIYRMTEEEVCKKKVDDKCSLEDVYIYQMTNSRIMIVPKYVPLNETVYTRRQKPQIEFNLEELKKLKSLKGYYLKITGLTETELIELDKLFKFNEDSMNWLYWIVGITVLMTLLMIFILVLYQNWGVEEGQPLSNNRETLKLPPLPSKNSKSSQISFNSPKSSKKLRPRM